MTDSECIEKLYWALDDLLRLQETSEHVHLGAINAQNLPRLITDIDRVKMELESRQPEPEQPKKVTKEFYCSACFLQQHEVLCNPEDGALVGFCTECESPTTFLHGCSPKKETKS